MNNFYTINFTNASEIQSILGFDSSVLEKGVYNPKRYYLSTNCNQIVVSNGNVRYLLSIPTGYYTFIEFIEAIDIELGEVVSLVSTTIKNEYVVFYTQGDGWYFDHENDNTTIDKFGWIPWFKLSPTTQNMYIERPKDGPTTADDDNMDGYAYLEPTYLICSYQHLNDYGVQYLAHPSLAYTMFGGSIADTNVIDFENGYYVQRDLLSSCLELLNDRYVELRNIPPSHQEGIAREQTNCNYYSTWSAKGDYSPNLVLYLGAEIIDGSLISTNTDFRGGHCGPWNSIDCDEPNNIFFAQDVHYTIIVDNVSSSHTISSGDYLLATLSTMLINSIHNISPGIIDTVNQVYRIVLSSTKSITTTFGNPFFTIPNGTWTTLDFRQ